MKFNPGMNPFHPCTLTLGKRKKRLMLNKIYDTIKNKRIDMEIEF
jgi:hypothetical protein